MSGLPVLRPTDDTWTLVESWAARAADAGERVALADLMIGALASEIQGLVWPLDGDFKRLAKLGLVNLLPLTDRAELARNSKCKIRNANTPA